MILNEIADIGVELEVRVQRHKIATKTELKKIMVQESE